MESGTGDRGVSEVMGFILVFGMLVLSFTIYQGLVVPDQNRQVEFQHNQDVQGQLQDLRNAIVSTAATGSGQAVSVTLGASYPKRAIAQNLGVSGGSIQTTDASAITIENVEALDGETKDYLNGSVGPFETKSITYHPTYSFYSGAPETVYENSLAYNRFDGSNLTITNQLVIDGRRITLIAINGSLSEAQRDTVSISTEAISASSNRVAVRNASGGPINVTIPTQLSVTEWEDALEDEMGGSGHVEGVYDVPGENAVNVSLKPGVTYELRMAKIGIGDVTSDEGPKYITAVEGNGVSVSENGTQKLVVEVRDRFNNPVSNVTVSNQSGTPAVGTLSPTSETTNSDGRASFSYTAPDDVDGVEDVTVELEFDGDGTVNETVTFDLKVLDSDGSGGGGSGGSNSINPSADQKTIVYVNSTTTSSNNNDVTLHLNNTDTSPIQISKVRFQFYSTEPQAGGGGQPESMTFGGSGNVVPYLGSFTSVSGITMSPGVNAISLEFFSDGAATSDHDTREGDFLILTVTTGDGEIITYFLGITNP